MQLGVNQILENPGGLIIDMKTKLSEEEFINFVG